MNSASPLLIATYGTLFTFLCTTLGAAVVLFGRKKAGGGSKDMQNLCFGFASGVMMAASVWSLLMPAMEHAETLGKTPWIPAGLGFLLGGALLWLVDKLLERIYNKRIPQDGDSRSKRKRTAMLVIAVTLHNIPEGMAVGLAFALACLGNDTGAMASAVALAIGIGLQNIPEGAAISLPLREGGMGKLKSFASGALSGFVEPVFGIAAVLLAGSVQAVMPWLLSIAAGAMIFVVASELIPESAEGKHPHFGVIGVMAGFVIMMVMDVALG